MSKKETPLKDRIGQRFGCLTVIATERKEFNGRRRGFITFRCDCGTVKTVLSHNVLNCRTKSCGCKTSEFKSNPKHGLHQHKIYKTYYGMKQRCYNPKNARYHRYGGRGIIICKEWLDDFMSFYKWSTENGFADDLTIERVNNDGDYCPGNCKWATMQEQLKNRSYRKAANK